MSAQRLTTGAKADAKKLVSAKFGKLGLLTLITQIIVSIPLIFIIVTAMLEIVSSSLRSDISGILMSTVSLFITMFLVSTPMAFGQIKCFYDVYKTGDFEWKTLFTAFQTLDNYKRALKYGVLIFFKLILWFIPLSIAIYAGLMQLIFTIFAYTVYTDFILTPIIIFIIMAVISLILLLVIMIKSVKYYAGYLTLIDVEDIGCKGALKQGLDTLKGYNKEIVYFGFSFILWYILSAITYGLATFFISPYIVVSLITLVKKIEEEKARKELEKLQATEMIAENTYLENTNITEEISNIALENVSNTTDEELKKVNQKLENKDNIEN